MRTKYYPTIQLMFHLFLQMIRNCVQDWIWHARFLWQEKKNTFCVSIEYDFCIRCWYESHVSSNLSQKTSRRPFYAWVTVLFELLHSDVVLGFAKQHEEGLFYMSNDGFTEGYLVVQHQFMQFKAMLACSISYTTYINQANGNYDCYKHKKRRTARDLH